LSNLRGKVRLSVIAYKEGNGLEDFFGCSLYISKRPFLECSGIEVLYCRGVVRDQKLVAGFVVNQRLLFDSDFFKRRQPFLFGVVFF
jgi:hypothetical protein